MTTRLCTGLAKRSRATRRISASCYFLLIYHRNTSTAPALPRSTKRSLIQQMQEYDEEGELKDKDLDMDWDKIDMQGRSPSRIQGFYMLGLN